MQPFAPFLEGGAKRRGGVSMFTISWGKSNTPNNRPKEIRQGREPAAVVFRVVCPHGLTARRDMV